MLVKFIGEKKDSWEDYLDTCIYAYNTSKHESSKFTPFELMFSRIAVLPVDIQSDAELPECLEKETEGVCTYKTYYTSQREIMARYFTSRR